MNAQLAPDDSDFEPAPEGARALLRSVVITDLCDSTALVDRLGDVRATELIRAHDRLLRGLIREHRGQEIDKTDGFLSLFERPIQAVAFALAYQRGLRAFSLEHGVDMSARIGLHVGEVMTWQNDEADVAKGAKPTEVEGLAKPVAARLMGMALPGQILLSGVAYTLAHRAEGELGAALSRVQWKGHGDFRFKGVAEAVPVYEIGEEGIAPFKAPAWSGKAHREVPLWRRPVMLAFEAIALIVAVALPAWHFLKPEPAIAFAERDWVVLGDLRNLTGDPRFDDSLEQAFRIGLEQSRHVNLVSPIRTRQALELMQRDPDDTLVDRQIGSELAVREQARALVLPTLAEVGGRLRFTAEVVDPQNQTTVLSLAADGNSIESVLLSVDEVNRELRGRLGEAVQQIEGESLPLERAATPNIDALRAYTLAVRAEQENRLQDALALLEQALSLDPEFALALMKRGVILRNSADREGARESLKAALELERRLSPRDRLSIEGFLAELEGTPGETLRRWRLLAELYPDHLPGTSTYGFYAWALANDTLTAERTLRSALDERNPGKGTVHYTLGVVLMAQDRIEEALAQFKSYEASGRRFENQFYAGAHAVRRDFSNAKAALDRGTRGGVTTRQLPTQLTDLVLDMDQGQLDAVAERLRGIVEAAASMSARQQAMARNWQLSAAALFDTKEQAIASLGAAAAALEASDTGHDQAARFDLVRTRILVAWLASRLGEISLADTQLAAIEGQLRAEDHPELAQRLLLAQVAQACASGDTAAGLRRLQPLLDSGKAFYSAHVTRFDCLLEPDALDRRAAQAEWLANHRGLAYSEIHGDYALWMFNVAFSTMVWLELAEAARGASPELAEQSLRRLEQSWPATQWTSELRARVAAVQLHAAP